MVLYNRTTTNLLHLAATFFSCFFFFFVLVSVFIIVSVFSNLFPLMHSDGPPASDAYERKNKSNVALESDRRLDRQSLSLSQVASIGIIPCGMRLFAGPTQPTTSSVVASWSTTSFSLSSNFFFFFFASFSVLIVQARSYMRVTTRSDAHTHTHKKRGDQGGGGRNGEQRKVDRFTIDM